MIPDAPGALYREAVRFLAGLAPGVVRAAAQEWAGYAGVLDDVDTGLKAAARSLHGSELVGATATALYGRATDTERALTQVRTVLGPGPLSLTGGRGIGLDGSAVDVGGSGTPTKILTWLADEMESVKATAADFAAANPLPDADESAWRWLMGGPDPRGEWDEIAETWLSWLLTAARTATDAMSRISLDWPNAAVLQQADPAATAPR